MLDSVTRTTQVSVSLREVWESHPAARNPGSINRALAGPSGRNHRSRDGNGSPSPLAGHLWPPMLPICGVMRLSSKIRAHAPRLATSDTRRVRPPPKVADPFYLSPEWRALMRDLIKTRGRRCEIATCRRSHDETGRPVRIYGDHIHELRDGGAPLDPDNVMLLCAPCHGLKTARARAVRAGAEPDVVPDVVPRPQD